MASYGTWSIQPTQDYGTATRKRAPAPTTNFGFTSPPDFSGLQGVGGAGGFGQGTSGGWATDPAGTPQRTRTTTQNLRPDAPRGALQDPGEGEQWWTSNKTRLAGPSTSSQYYNGLMGRTGGAGLQPTAVSEAYDKSRAYFDSPTMAETNAQTNLGQLGQKGYTEKLYEAGGDHLNPYYDRAREKGMKALQDRMAAAGVFGSGATAKAMFELEGELGAAQARDMAGLATQADQAAISRYGEGRNTAESGTGAMRTRYSDQMKGANDVFGATRDAEKFNQDAAFGTEDRARLRDESNFDMARQAQGLYETREKGGLAAKQALADRYSNLFTDWETKSIDEQARIKENVIQSIVAEGQMDYIAAQQEVEDMLRMAQLGVTAAGKTGTTGSTSTGTYDPDAPLPPTR